METLFAYSWIHSVSEIRVVLRRTLGVNPILMPFTVTVSIIV